MTVKEQQILELKVRGMDCAECTEHIQHAVAALPGVESVSVLLTAEKAIIRLDPARVDIAMIDRAVTDAGYSIVPPDAPDSAQPAAKTDVARAIFTTFGLVVGAILLIVIVGEGFGLFETLTDWLPQPVGWLLVLLGGFPIFRNVVEAALRRQVISHTLMSVGVVAALIVGQWPTAMVVVFFMYIGNYAEGFTAKRSRQALKNLTSLAPRKARVERNGNEIEVPVGDVRVGEIVVVRPGETIPVDGQVVSGQATVEQAAITGEAMPVEVATGSAVYAATLARLGSIRVHTTRIGADTTFGRVIRLVEEAESHRAPIQRIADRFSAYYLPVVLAIAALTLLITRNPLATAAVLVVACSCSFAVATPIAMLATIGAAARQGLLIKGGKYIEVLARADTLLLDKTGTLTTGRPRITDIVGLNGWTEAEVLRLAASAERYSEHPLAEAVRECAREKSLTLAPPHDFVAVPGQGVQAVIAGKTIRVGNLRMLDNPSVGATAEMLAAQGKTLLFVAHDAALIGILAAADTLRPEVAAALEQVRALGIQHIELLTGDNDRAAAALAGSVGIAYRAGLLPEDKIAVVKEYQAQGRTVGMVGDGINDAPALAQADVGIAMGASGTDVAIEAAHVVLMREDWQLVPLTFTIARRTMGVVRMNIGFTALYNLVGLSLAALGIVPPILAAAAQSLPDVGILANSSRLLRTRTTKSTPKG